MKLVVFILVVCGQFTISTLILNILMISDYICVEKIGVILVICGRYIIRTIAPNISDIFVRRN